MSPFLIIILLYLDATWTFPIDTVSCGDDRSRTNKSTSTERDCREASRRETGKICQTSWRVLPDQPNLPGELPQARLLSAHDPVVVVVVVVNDPCVVGPPQATRAGGVGRCCLCCCGPQRRLGHKGRGPPTSLRQGKKTNDNSYNIIQRTSFSYPILSDEICYFCKDFSLSKS